MVEKVAKAIARDRFRENGHGELDDTRWAEMRDWYLMYKDDPDALSAHGSLPATAYRQARAALDACHAEEMRNVLAGIASYPDANVISDAHYVARKEARDLLAKMEARP
jgi:hypothetical protein